LESLGSIPQCELFRLHLREKRVRTKQGVTHQGISSKATTLFN
jgi:hypothetical protein